MSIVHKVLVIMQVHKASQELLSLGSRPPHNIVGPGLNLLPLLLLLLLVVVVLQAASHES